MRPDRAPRRALYRRPSFLSRSSSRSCGALPLLAFHTLTVCDFVDSFLVVVLPLPIACLRVSLEDASLVFSFYPVFLSNSPTDITSALHSESADMLGDPCMMGLGAMRYESGL